MNWTSSYDTAHHALSISGTTYVSFMGSGGVVQRPSVAAEVFRAATDFHAEWVRSYINNVKEALALYEVLRLLVDSRPDFLRASIIMMDVDTKTMLHAVQKGRAHNELTPNVFRKLFWR